MATDNIATLGIKVDPRGAVSGATRAKRAITGIGNAANKVKNQILSLNGAMGALGAGAVLKSVIDSASGIESLRVRLKFLTGSTKDAGKAFDTMRKFASKVPFALEEIQKASPSLLTVTDDVDELNELLSITGDIAAVSGLSFEQTAQQIQRSFAGGISAADLFRESGIKAMLGFEEGVKYSADETKKHVLGIFRDGSTSMKGATNELANTFIGQVSMMKDAWFDLKLQFADTGIFLEVKDAVVGITESLAKKETAQQVREFGKTILTLGRNIKGIISDFMSLPEYVKQGGLILAIFGGMKGKAALGIMIAFEDTVSKMYNEIGGLMGVVSRDIDTVLEDIMRVESAIGLIKASIKKGGEGSLLDVIGMGDKSTLEGLNEELAKLKLEVKDILSNTDLGELLKPVDLTNRLYSNEPVPNQNVENDPRPAIFADAEKAVDKYTNSLIKVGVVETKRKQLEKAYNAEVSRIRESNKTSLEQEELLIEKATNAYEDAIKRMDEADIASKVAGIASSMESSITDMVMNIGNGANSLKDTVKDMARAILAEFVKIQVARPAANFLAGLTSNMFSFDGGGYTGSGSRSGGIDGKGGFQAVLHPNETVVDHTKGQSVGNSGGETNVNVSFNITANDTDGFDELLDSRRGMIVGIINQAMNDRGITGVTA